MNSNPDFYRQISGLYDQLFPLNPGQVHFVRQHIEDLPSAAVLDVGCGTGGLAIAISGPLVRVTGIDLNRAMLEQAASKDVEFETILQADSLEEEIRNTIALYPLRKQELAGLLNQSGFTISGLYGSFLMEPYTPESVPLIVTTTKNP